MKKINKMIIKINIKILKASFFKKIKVKSKFLMKWVSSGL